jgi:hypothetical protein
LVVVDKIFPLALDFAFLVSAARATTVEVTLESSPPVKLYGDQKRGYVAALKSYV